MSLVSKGDSWRFIDEEHFINISYKNVLDDSKCEEYACNPGMFDITQPFLYDSQHLKQITPETASKKRRKRKRSEDYSEVELLLQSRLKEIIGLSDCRIPLLKVCKDNNKNARCFQNLAKELQNFLSIDAIYDDFEQDDINDVKNTTALDLSRITSCLVSNPHNVSILKEISSQKFLIPPNSTFLMSDITRMEAISNADLLFDCIVIDPPWQNKSVKRKRLYNSMPMFDLKMLPIKNLCLQDCLIVVWVTNKTKFQDYIINELFPMWGVSLKAIWYWLKVTKTLTPVLPLNSSHKKPYEKLILGRFKGTNNSSLIDIPQDMTLISVPSSIHSHKPPLTNVLKEYLSADAKCLELFARNLLPGWCSWGNEVLLLQNEKLFQKFSDSVDLPETSVA